VHALVTASAGPRTVSAQEKGPGAEDASSGAAHREYRARLHPKRRDGEFQALLQLERLMGGGGAGSFEDGIRRVVFEAELNSVRQRLEFLTGWWGHLRGRLPAGGSSPGRKEVEAALDTFIRSRFPQLVYREAELSALATVLQGLAEAGTLPVDAESHAQVAALRQSLARLEADVAARGRRLLEARAA